MTQDKLIHPPKNNSTFSLRKMSVFQGAAIWHTNFTFTILVHSSFDKKINPSSQEAVHFSRRCCLAYISETQHQLTYPLLKRPTFSFRKMPLFQGVAPWHNNFTWSYAISLGDSAQTHRPVKSSTLPYWMVSEHWTLRYILDFILCHFSLRLSTSSLTLR